MEIKELRRLAKDLRHRAKTGERAHGLQWCNGVRFAANKVDELIKQLEKQDERSKHSPEHGHRHE